MEVVRKKLRDICQLLGVKGVELEGLVKIGDIGLFRGKIMDRELRDSLLSKTENLVNDERFKAIIFGGI